MASSNSFRERLTDSSGFSRTVGAWLFVAWILLVVVAYLYFMLRSFF